MQGMGDLAPDQGANLRPLYWQHKVLTTGPLGKSLDPLFFNDFLRAEF